MSSKALDDHIELTPDTAGGKPRIRGHRIRVQDIAIWHERLGKSADEIAAEYDLTLADVYAAREQYRTTFRNAAYILAAKRLAKAGG